MLSADVARLVVRISSHSLCLQQKQSPELFFFRIREANTPTVCTQLPHAATKSCFIAIVSLASCADKAAQVADSDTTATHFLQHKQGSEQHFILNIEGFLLWVTVQCSRLAHHHSAIRQ
jgi:hypothetical protein